MGEYGKTTKRIIFQDTDKRHADLKLKLHYDGLSQSEFFREVVSAYLEEDPLAIELVESFKEKVDRQKQRQRDIAKNDRKKYKQTESDFALNPDEVESIFDLLERETKI